MTRAKRAWLLAGALCATVIVVDQVAKAVVRSQIVLGEEIDVLGPLGLTQTHNTGVAFGLAGGTGAPLVIVMLVALGVVTYLFAQDPARPGMWVASGLLAGGAVGNLIDRIAAGHVTDFIELPPWPPFNVADVCITFGVVILVLIYLREGIREERARKQGEKGG
ncbi:MAG: signal peptidase II [Actinobacteria bacterium]|nr:signal peptidase II [Actinomycetota bacterium]